MPRRLRARPQNHPALRCVQDALRADDAPALRTMLACGASVAALVDGRPLLVVAAHEDAVQCVGALLALNSTLLTSDAAHSAMTEALINGAHAVVEALLDAGFDVNHEPSSADPSRPPPTAALALAAHLGPHDKRAAALALFFRHGARPDTPSAAMALWSATLHALPDCVRLLLAAGVDPNALVPSMPDTPTALHRVAATPKGDADYCARQRDIVAVLLAAGADPTVPNAEGDTAADLAVPHLRPLFNAWADHRALTAVREGGVSAAPSSRKM